MSDEDFVFPGMLDPLTGATPGSLHMAGLDLLQIRDDFVDVFPNDTDIAPDDRNVGITNEGLPQFGPPFVKAVMHKLTATERAVAALMEASMKRWAYEPTTKLFVASFQADASGNVGRNQTPNAAIVEPPPGFSFAIHRITVIGAGGTFGVPIAGANGFWELREDDEAIDGGSLVSPNGIPFVKTWGTRDAPRIRDGAIGSYFQGGSVAAFANKNLTVKLQGTWERDPDA